MDELAKEHIIDLYSKSLMHHGPGPEAVFWSGQGQQARFNAITSLIPRQSNLSLLDYGCGLGDLFAHLRASGFDLSYTGMDITPPMIEAASIRHPEAEFHVFDLEQSAHNAAYDVTVLCGVFNYNVQGARQSFINTLRLLIANTRLRLIASVLSAKTDAKQHDLLYFNPDELLKTLKREVSSSARTDLALLPDDIVIIIDTRTP